MTEQESRQIEQAILDEVDLIEVKPYSETMDAIRSRLIRYNEKPTRKIRLNREIVSILSVAMSLVVLFGIGTIIYFAVDWDSDGNRNQGVDSLYEDKDITIFDYPEPEFLELPMYEIGRAHV